MTRKILVITLTILSGMLCWSQNAAVKASLRLQHLPNDAQTTELSKFVSDLMSCDSNPLNYLPILSQLDSITELLNRFDNINTIGLDKFTADLHTLAEAKEVLNKPYDGVEIKALANRIDGLTFHSQSQMDNQDVKSIIQSVTEYYGRTTLFKDLLTDIINGQKEFMSVKKDKQKAEKLNKIDENLNFDLRNERISRIPYMKEQLDVVFKSCPRDDRSGNLMPERFDVKKLQELYDANERARATRVKDNGKKSKDDKSQKNGKKKKK